MSFDNHTSSILSQRSADNTWRRSLRFHPPSPSIQTVWGTHWLTSVLPDAHLERSACCGACLADLFICEHGELPLDQIQPRRARLREVDVKARMSSQPASYTRRVVCAVVVENQ